MVVVAESPLSSLAMVKVNWDRGNDYIDNFVPFVEEAFRRARHDEVAIEDLQVSIFDLFGLRIPQGALQTIIRRLVKRGVLKRAQGLIRRLPSKLGDGSFDADRGHRGFPVVALAWPGVDENQSVLGALTATAHLPYLRVKYGPHRLAA